MTAPNQTKIIFDNTLYYNTIVYIVYYNTLFWGGQATTCPNQRSKIPTYSFGIITQHKKEVIFYIWEADRKCSLPLLLYKCIRNDQSTSKPFSADLVSNLSHFLVDQAAKTVWNITFTRASKLINLTHTSRTMLSPNCNKQYCKVLICRALFISVSEQFETRRDRRRPTPGWVLDSEWDYQQLLLHIMHMC